MEHPEQTLSRAEIVEAVWGADNPVDGRTVDQYVKRLRVALESIGASDMLKTARGFGYRLDAMPIWRANHGRS